MSTNTPLVKNQVSNMKKSPTYFKNAKNSMSMNRLNTILMLDPSSLISTPGKQSSKQQIGLAKYNSSANLKHYEKVQLPQIHNGRNHRDELKVNISEDQESVTEQENFKVNYNKVFINSIPNQRLPLNIE